VPFTHRTEFLERRQQPRFRIALAVTFRDSAGLTRDVSASGVFFEFFNRLADYPSPGSVVQFSLLLEHADANGPVEVECEGEVVRVEPAADHPGVAVHMASYHFRRGDTVDVSRWEGLMATLGWTKVR
jgi:PilZ domain-containing protein